jgi:hypothetical protein
MPLRNIRDQVLRDTVPIAIADVRRFRLSIWDEGKVLFVLQDAYRRRRIDSGRLLLLHRNVKHQLEWTAGSDLLDRDVHMPVYAALCGRHVPAGYLVRMLHLMLQPAIRWIRIRCPSHVAKLRASDDPRWQVLGTNYRLRGLWRQL